MKKMPTAVRKSKRMASGASFPQAMPGAGSDAAGAESRAAIASAEDTPPQASPWTHCNAGEVERAGVHDLGSDAGAGHVSAQGAGADRGEGLSSAAAPRHRRARQEQTPVQRALGLLTRREHSRKELTRKLTARGLDPVGVEQAVDKLADAGWQDDARFAESLVRARAGTGYGPLHLRAELSTHGLDREQVTRALENFEGDWRLVARDLLLRRFPDALSPADMDPSRRRKAVELLMRRGFDGDCIRAALAGEEAGFDD